MIVQRQIAWLLLLSALFATGACERKKPPKLPPKAQAPTIGPENLPDHIPVPSTEPEPTVVVQDKPPQAPPQTPPKKTRRSTQAKKQAPPPAAPVVSTQPPATVTTSPSSNGTSAGTTTVATVHPPQPIDTAIAADVSRETATAQKQNTTQLLEATEKTVNGLNAGSLNDDQKNMLAQIWTYINQSKKAETDGDLERAFNLATKAHLLSDALVKK